MIERPEMGDLSRCLTCHEEVEYVLHEQWNGAEYDVLDWWWSHVVHPSDGHDARVDLA